MAVVWLSMRRCLLLFAVLLAGCAEPPARYGLVIHGGAGSTGPSLTPEREAAVAATLDAALDAGYAVLDTGGTSLDAVEVAILVLEDSPLFNAGRGAVYTHEETHELDAAIMEGAERRAGAVAGVRRVKNPIRLARLVMERSPHVLMAGEGAEAFGVAHGIEMVDPSYFDTPERLEALRRAIAKDSLGTVGCVALDRHGNLAAATSTGGMTNKRFGRIGDVPLIGAGTFADNATCAVSATGHGEWFIRYAVAHDIAARMAYRGDRLERAAHDVVMEQLAALDARGGVIALDAKGRFAMPFNTEAMSRGYRFSDGSHAVMVRETESAGAAGKSAAADTREGARRMGAFETIEAGGKTVRAYAAGEFESGTPGVVLFHAWWGINDDVIAFADRLAAAGFAVLAPDMYGGAQATTIEEAEGLSEALDEAAADAIALGAVDHLTSRLGAQAKVGAVGFSMGAPWAMWTAARRPQVGASVVYYGTVGGAVLGAAQVPVLGHFAASDPYESEENLAAFERALREAGRNVAIHRYAGAGHWFAEPSQAAWRREAAEQAFERTAAFLAAHLGPARGHR